MKKALVSVTGVDKPGIIAKVSTALYELNVNVLEISQTILDGYDLRQHSLPRLIDWVESFAPAGDRAVGAVTAAG